LLIKANHTDFGHLERLQRNADACDHGISQ